MRSLGNWLKAPYFLNVSLWYRLKQALFFSFFVIVFLYFFKPFGLSDLGDALFVVALNFGGLTLAVMLVLNILIPINWTSFFNEEKWTVGRELLWNFLNIAIIGLSNAIYGFERFDQSISLQTLLFYEAYTLGVALFPISLTVLIKESRSKQKFEKESSQLNNELVEHPQHHVSAKTHILLSSETATESLQIDPDDLLFIASADNYVEVHYLETSQLKRKLLRNTLRAIESETAACANLWRCHKSYLVNLDRVVKTSGNAQGYKLHFSETDQSIPVSRTYNSELKHRLSQ